MWTLLALAVAAILIAAWIDGGAKPQRWMEQPLDPAASPAQGAA